MEAARLGVGCDSEGEKGQSRKRSPPSLPPEPSGPRGGASVGRRERGVGRYMFLKFNKNYE